MRNILVFLGGIAVVLVAAVGLYQWLGKPTAPAPAPQQQAATAPASPAAPATAQDAASVRPGDFAIGRADAPVTVIEYASLTCPHCRNFHENGLPQLKSQYVDSGKVRMVYRDFPLDGLALRASMLARCAGRDRFFAFLDILFKRQAQWAGSNDPLGALARVAALGGLGPDEFKACLANKEIETQVLQQRQEAEQVFGVNSTPSFIVNGRKVRGADFNAVKAAIDPLLGKPGN
ncbi:MAG: DsbA family protein [Alphaproteobacteria bacterium]|nr:DsbA family protein [Alphaproteobacteria bacterium]